MNKISIIALLLATTSAIRISGDGKPLPASGIPAELGIGGEPAKAKPVPAKAPKPTAKVTTGWNGTSNGDSQSLAKTQSLADGKPLPASGIPAELGIGGEPAKPKPVPAKAPKPTAPVTTGWNGTANGDSQSLAKTQSLATGKPLPASGIPAELGIGGEPAKPKPVPAKAPKPTAPVTTGWNGTANGDSQSLLSHH